MLCTMHLNSSNDMLLLCFFALLRCEFVSQDTTRARLVWVNLTLVFPSGSPPFLRLEKIDHLIQSMHPPD